MILKDRVKQITGSQGTGNITLAGTPDGFQSFDSVLSSGNTTYYCLENGSAWEVGEGTYLGSSILSRDTVLDSSTGSKLSLSGRTIAFITYPADRMTYLDNLNEMNISLEAMNDVSLTAPGSGEALLYDGAEWINSALPAGYSNEEAQDAVGSILVNTSSVELAYSDVTPSISAVIATSGVTNDMLAGPVSVAKGGTGLTALGTALQVLRTNAGATALEFGTVDLSSYVAGPASATDNAIVRFDATTGKLVQNSSQITISDSGVLSQSVPTGIGSCYRISGSSVASGIALIAGQNADYGGLSLGAYWTGSDWLPTDASAALFYKIPGMFLISGNTGLTPGGAGFGPTYRFNIDLATGKVGINTSTTVANAQLQVTSGGSATVGLTVKAAASQSANLTEWQNSSGTVGARVTAAREFSNTLGQTNSENFGAGAVCTSQDAVAFGKSASADFVSVAIGSNSVAYTNGVAIGYGAYHTGTASGQIAIGSEAYANQNAIAIGYQAKGRHRTVAIGHQANAADNQDCVILGALADSTSANQFVAGSSSYPIDNVYFGKGVINAAPTAYTINGTGGSGTNIAGAGIIIAGGRGTGTGLGGSFKVQVAPAGSTGSSANALVDALTIDSTYIWSIKSGTKLVDTAAYGNNWVQFTGAGALSLSGQTGLTLAYSGATLITLTPGTTNICPISSESYSHIKNSITGNFFSQQNASYSNVFSHYSAAGIPLTVKAAASQTANLTEWQNSSGTVLDYITNVGVPYFRPVMNDAGFVLLEVSPSNLAQSTDYFRLMSNGASANDFLPIFIARSTGPNGALGFSYDTAGSWSSGIIPGIDFQIKNGNNEQTSTNRPAFAFRNYSTALTTVSVNGAWLYTPRTPGTVPATFKAAASQSANLIECQNSSGVVGLSVSAANKLYMNVSVTSAVTNPDQLKIEDGSTGGYFSISEGASGGAAYLPVFRGRSAGVNGAGIIVSGAVPTANDSLAATLATIVLEGARDNSGTLTSVSNANILAVTNFGTVLFKIGVSGIATLTGDVVASKIVRQSTETTSTPAGTTQTITLNDGNHQSLDLSSSSGDVTVTLTVPTTSSAGTIILKQHGSTPRNITWGVSAGTIMWMGSQPTWNADAVSSERVLSWRYNGTKMYLAVTETGV